MPAVATDSDPFALLGVSPGASEEELQAAYRARARACHPDLHPNDPSAAEEFRRITEAYETLKFRNFSLPYSEQEADRTHIDIENATQVDIEHAAEKARRQAERVRDAVDGMFGDRSPPRAQPPRPQPSSPPPRPRARSGGSAANVVRDEGPGRGTVEVPFEAAIVGGAHVLDVQPTGGLSMRRLRITLPCGVKPGDKFRIESEVVEAVIPTHAYFRREGDDVLVDVPLSVSEAYFGARVRVPTVDGGVELSFPAGTRAGQRFRLRGKGVPGRGDQFCVAQVAIPESDGPRIRALIREIDEIDSHSPRAWDPPGAKTRPGTT